MIKPFSSAYGGQLLNTRRGRSRPRPLAVRATMHLVLRSSRAKGDLSFRRAKHKHKISEIVARFSKRHGVLVRQFANVGNHLHFHVQLRTREAYRPFIRGMTAAIAMAVTGVSRWSRPGELRRKGFWDLRPFTRILHSRHKRLTLQNYIEINQLEGMGYSRGLARERIQWWNWRRRRLV